MQHHSVFPVVEEWFLVQEKCGGARPNEKRSEAKRGRRMSLDYSCWLVLLLMVSYVVVCGALFVRNFGRTGCRNENVTDNIPCTGGQCQSVSQ